MRQKLPLPAVSVPAVAPDAEPRERMDRIDDVIWVPCRGCTDLAGCEDHRACLTLDGWEVKHG